MDLASGDEMAVKDLSFIMDKEKELGIGNAETFVEVESLVQSMASFETDDAMIVSPIEENIDTTANITEMWTK